MLRKILINKSNEYLERALIDDETWRDINALLKIELFDAAVHELEKANNYKKVGLPENLEFHTFLSGK